METDGARADDGGTNHHAGDGGEITAPGPACFSQQGNQTAIDVLINDWLLAVSFGQLATDGRAQAEP